MNSLQRALADTLLEFMVDHRLAGKPFTKWQQQYAIRVAKALGMRIGL